MLKDADANLSTDDVHGRPDRDRFGQTRKNRNSKAKRKPSSATRKLRGDRQCARHRTAWIFSSKKIRSTSRALSSRSVCQAAARARSGEKSARSHASQEHARRHAAYRASSSIANRTEIRIICEIFLVEGDSAGGTAKMRPRLSNTQAILAAARQDSQRLEKSRLDKMLRQTKKSAR